MGQRILYEKIDKTKIENLPLVIFEGKIWVIDSLLETEKAVDFLRKQSVVGIDTETRPSFRRGVTYKVSLLQVATEEICFLFRLNHTGMPSCLVQLLQDSAVCKVGLSLRDDFQRLRELTDLQVANYVDLQQKAAQMGLKDMSLQKLYANFFGRKISKRQRLSNWEADVLTDSQKKYAATDAWACIKLYKEMCQLMQTHDYRLLCQYTASEYQIQQETTN